MRLKAQKRMNKKISVANGLGAALQTNIAVADASAARRITATETPAQKSVYRDRINTNVFELNVVLTDSMHCGIAFDSPGGSLVSTSESSHHCSPQLSKSTRLRMCSYSPSSHNRLNTGPLSPSLEPHRRCGSPGQIISASRLSPRLAYRNNRTRASVTSSTSVVARFRKSFFVNTSTSSIDISGRLTPDPMNRTIAAPARVKKFIKRKKKEKGRREMNIVMVTVLFSLNFVTWNCILLFYYFSYAVSPSTEVLNTIARDNKVVLTYLNGWFYYATFLTSSVNPVIHFVCNSKIRTGFKHIHDKVVSGFYRKFAACNCA
ncbi:uncharacterized protein LOC134817064 [Bolinopsis microptera]|uniref:uncharacterized protein LOC134817064 n=1 Tax=Bolinopsis microptera TaxID=2820187 RepID=UPI0030797564